MKVLGLDFETQSDDAKTTRITEVGAVLYDYVEESNRFVEISRLSTLCYEPDYPPQTDKIIQLTGITDHMLKTKGVPRATMLDDLLTLVEMADIVVCHKTSFDWTVLKSTAKLFEKEVPNKELLCTLTNFNWPKHITCKKLSHIAYEHGIMVDPRTLHRADQDVELMMTLLSHYDFKEVLHYARIPWVYFKGDVLGPWQDGGKQNAIAKELGFGWEQIKGVDQYRWPKTWVVRVKQGTEDLLVDQIMHSESPFRITKIEGL